MQCTIPRLGIEMHSDQTTSFQSPKPVLPIPIPPVNFISFSCKEYGLTLGLQKHKGEKAISPLKMV